MMFSSGKFLKVSNAMVSVSKNGTFFPFHHLPVLIQWKIFRQYIPFLYKAFVLYHMPEFSKLLENPQSWIKPSFFECFSLLCSLQKGIYIYLENFAKKAYYVSMNQTEITFAMCGLDTYPSEYKVCATSSRYPINPFESGYITKMTLSAFHKFLTTFLSNYTLSREHVVKVYEFRGFCFVNYSTNKVHWNNGKVYDIIDHLCIIRLDEYKWYHIVLKDNYRIELRVNPINVFGEEYKNCVALETKILTPISLETFLLFKEKQVYNFRIICEINFQFVIDNEINLDFYAFHPRMCFDYLDAALMDCLEGLKDVFDEHNIV